MKGFFPGRSMGFLPSFFSLGGFLGFGLLLAGASCRSQSETLLPLVWLEIGGQRIRVEVADTPPTQQSGLMFRKKLGKDQGMLFVFDRPAPRAFWMKNTYIPLSIAFMDAEGTVLNILEMTPQDLSNYHSKGPAQYALEMNKGWFAQRGVKPGDRIQGLPRPSR